MTPPGAWPTREEIAAIIHATSRREGFPLERSVCGYVADALLARLRPAWERMEQQANRPKCLYCTFGEDADFTVDDLKQHIENECDFHPLRALRADLARVTEHANHYSERVGKLVLELDTLRETLAACVTALEKLLESSNSISDTALARAALARPGGKT